MVKMVNHEGLEHFVADIHIKSFLADGWQIVPDEAPNSPAQTAPKRKRTTKPKENKN